ncbi:NAD(P)H-binding protein [Nocardia inohanensis]|uniref:NAD(P)H-binding protein n=1 Tax=Nocardia inohanensis TaxID=209246 RepID=UPI000831B350|nr:NAD(P)H-binding protein [Nocardia inohanensis]
MIAVMGATGAVGNALLTRLLELGLPCRALSREPDRLRHLAHRADIRYADAADPAALRAAFDGATQLFLTMSNSPAQIELETRAIEIAAVSGIEHVVKLSAPAVAADSPVAVARWHHAIEEVLRASCLAHTILRPYAFMQKLLLLGPEVAAQHTIVGAMGAAPCNYIDCRDIADVAAAALTRAEIAGGAYILTGSQTYSYPRLAALLSSLLGTPIRYLDLSPADFRRHLTERPGLPAWLADHIVEIQQLTIARPEHPTGTVARVLGRPPRTLESFLAENLGSFSG